MLIGPRLKALRETKNLTQGDIEHATGLTRPYISRVENGHSIPGITILEKWARALGMPLYELLYDGEKPPAPPNISPQKEDKLWGDSGLQAAELNRLRNSLAKLNDKERDVLLSLVSHMASRSRSR